MSLERSRRLKRRRQSSEVISDEDARPQKTGNNHRQDMDPVQQKQLIDLYILADKYDVTTLNNSLIDILYNSINQPGSRPPSRKLVRHAYENTAPGSPMRQLLASWYAWDVDPEWYSQKGVTNWLPTVPDFAAQLATSMAPSMALRIKDPEQNPLNDAFAFQEPL
ncbi:MAG: hypothetical protein L6R41_000482 [Letrouitia leprolyta]|nr:MAG: hypothetical protein L6R41_000482 [Letrouitia leprolyta]